jgi:hypothetical protein
VSELSTLPQHNTKAQAFIAMRGALILKEVFPIGVLTGQRGSKLEVDTLTIAVMIKGKIEQAYAVRVITYTKDNEGEQVCLIDQDELPELINGIAYINEKLTKLYKGSVLNYAELFYTTKDGLRIGFFVTPSRVPEPSVFCSAGGEESAFMPAKSLPQIKKLFEKSLDKLLEVSKGEM